MASLNQYILAVSPYQGTETILVEDHTVPDIIDGIEYKHKKDLKQYDLFSSNFWKGTPEKTAKFIFDYLKNNVYYDIEHPNDQSVKGPGAIIGDRFGDCKHYALFANGVLDSLRRKGYLPGATIAYRFAGYNNSKDVHHVFSVLTVNGREYWIDPVLNNFNQRHPYSVAKDVKIMPLKEINGIGAAGAGNIFQDIKKGFQNTVKKVTTTAQKVAPQVTQPIMKIGIAPARNSFLLLLKMNGFNIAHRLYDFIHRSKENERELRDKWQSMGGSYNTLKDQINHGMNAYLARNKQTMADYNKQKGFINGTFPTIQDQYNYMGCCGAFPYYYPTISDNARRVSVGEPVTAASAATLITAAAAVIAALAPILKKAGWKQEDQQNAQNMAQAGAAALSYASMAQSGTKFETGGVMLPNGATDNLLTATVNTAADGTKIVDVKDNMKMSQAVDGSASETFRQMFDSVKTFVVENKTPIIIGLVGIGVWKSGILQSKKGRK